MATRLSQILKSLREESGQSQQAFAEALGISRSAVGNYEQGTREPDMETLEKIADLYNVNMDFLYGKTDIRRPDMNLASLYDTYDNIMPIKTKKIPLLGEIACGEPIYADQDFESYVEVGTDIRADFALRASGDSMIGARIKDGDIVFVRKQDIVDPGEIAAVIIEGEATLKRVYYQEGNRLILQAENSAYPPMVYEADKLNQITILGKAIAFQSDVR